MKNNSNNELAWVSKYFTKPNNQIPYDHVFHDKKKKRMQTAQLAVLTCFLWPNYKEFW